MSSATRKTTFLAPFGYGWAGGGGTTDRSFTLPEVQLPGLRFEVCQALTRVHWFSG